MKSVDLLIIGCGLAGSAIAWQAHRRGMSIAIADRNERQSCSMVAAGLVTPITGSRAAASWEWDLFYSEASQFYPWIEDQVQGRCWPRGSFYQKWSEHSLKRSGFRRVRRDPQLRQHCQWKTQTSEVSTLRGVAAACHQPRDLIRRTICQ
jgi:glycine/D-amino acid oxidase-like deaminating enzyme